MNHFWIAGADQQWACVCFYYTEINSNTNITRWQLVCFIFGSKIISRIKKMINKRCILCMNVNLTVLELWSVWGSGRSHFVQVRPCLSFFFHPLCGSGSEAFYNHPSLTQGQMWLEEISSLKPLLITPFLLIFIIARGIKKKSYQRVRSINSILLINMH